MRPENGDHLPPATRLVEAHNTLLPYLARIAAALEGKAKREEQMIRLLEAKEEREERLVRAIELIAESQRRQADAVAPDPTTIVDTRYVAKRLGLKTTQAVRDRIKAGLIPAACIVPGSGNGSLWKFHREKIDELAG